LYKKSLRTAGGFLFYAKPGYLFNNDYFCQMDPIFIKIADVRGGFHFINIKHIYEVEEIANAKAKERLTHIRYYSIPDCKGQVNKVMTKEFATSVLERIEQLKPKPLL